MATMHEIEVWVMVNDQGEYVAHESESDLPGEYEERVGELADAAGLRSIKIKVKVPLPAVIELEGEVPADEEPSSLKVA